MVIIPVNYNLLSVNMFVAWTGLYQLYRIYKLVLVFTFSDNSFSLDIVQAKEHPSNGFTMFKLLLIIYYCIVARINFIYLTRHVLVMNFIAMVTAKQINIVKMASEFFDTCEIDSSLSSVDLNDAQSFTHELPPVNAVWDDVPARPELFELISSQCDNQGVNTDTEDEFVEEGLVHSKSSPDDVQESVCNKQDNDELLVPAKPVSMNVRNLLRHKGQEIRRREEEEVDIVASSSITNSLTVSDISS